MGGEWDNHKLEVEKDIEKYKKYIQNMNSEKV